MKSSLKTELKSQPTRQVLAPISDEASKSASGINLDLSASFNGSDPAAMVCPNCGSRLEGRKCKLFCLRSGCGYQVTCAEW